MYFNETFRVLIFTQDSRTITLLIVIVGTLEWFQGRDETWNQRGRHLTFLI